MQVRKQVRTGHGTRDWLKIAERQAKDGEALYSQQKRPGPDCGSDHELLIAKFRLKLKKVGETARPFRYDLN